MSFEEYMLRAISLAEAFKYTAKPNPVVGALLVSKTGIISEGSHAVSYTHLTLPTTPYV